MSNKVDPKSSTPRSTYVELARLSHEAFVNRRNYEWKLHFGLWAALALVVYAAVQKKIHVFDSTKEAVLIGVVLLFSYVLHYLMVYRGHDIDKKQKHYYMDKAEGKCVNPPPPSKMPSWCISVFWALPYIVFTGSLIYITIRILLRI
jgi:hypothetical protein